MPHILLPLIVLAIRKNSGDNSNQDKRDVSFGKFLKVGVLAMLLALAAELGGAVLMQMLIEQTKDFVSSMRS